MPDAVGVIPVPPFNSCINIPTAALAAGDSPPDVTVRAGVGVFAAETPGERKDEAVLVRANGCGLWEGGEACGLWDCVDVVRDIA